MHLRIISHALILSAAVTLAFPVYAEYYIACSSCAAPVYVVKCKRHHVVHKSHKCKKPTYKHHRRNYYSVRVYYPVATCDYGCCNSCCYYGGCYRPPVNYWRTDQYYYVEPASYGYTYDEDYNPDLTTGDDNPSRYPGMNIDE